MGESGSAGGAMRPCDYDRPMFIESRDPPVDVLRTPWSWHGNTSNAGSCGLTTRTHGRIYLMLFLREGLRGATPAFPCNHMRPASAYARYDVNRRCIGKENARLDGSGVYRQDYSELAHPVARLIASAPEMLVAIESALAALHDCRRNDAMKVLAAARELALGYVERPRL